MKKFLMSYGFSSTAVVFNSAEFPNSNRKDKNLIRPTDLPIYSSETISDKISCSDEEESRITSKVEEGIRNIRKSLESVFLKYEAMADAMQDKISTGREHSQILVEFIRGDSTSEWPRIGAITTGGLIGYLLGIRGGKLKKIAFSGTVAIAVAAFCYPDNAEEAVHFAKHYTSIAYNFINGVKPEDENQLEIQWPKIPTSFSEVQDNIINIASFISSTISDWSKATKGSEKQLELKNDKVLKEDKD